MSMSRQKRRRNRKINNFLLLIMLILPLLVIVAFVMNIVRVRNTETGEGETIEEEEIGVIQNEYTNAYYSIGYNATEIDKQYFLELNDALEAETSDRGQIATSVVKCFITEYYTWTNKDGNYDIGGIQYIYSDKRKDFEKYTRYNFYADMDLYLTQNGRNALIEVKDVTVNSVNQNSGFVLEDGVTVLDCYEVDASWSYVEGSVMDTASIQSHALFQVTDHNGRMEIAAINYQEEVDYGY